MMDTSFNSRYSLVHNSPPYQSTPLIRRPTSSNHRHTNGSLSNGIQTNGVQHSNGIHRSPHSTEYKTPTSSIHMNDDDGHDYDNLSAKMNGGNSRSPASPASKLADIDTNTIIRQRKELQLMITELKERDKELNELVESHHKQLVSWEIDRERMANVEKQLGKVKHEYRKRHEQCKLLKDKLRKYEGEIQGKNRELVTLQSRLQQIEDRGNSSADHIAELDLKNKTLQCSIEELSNNVGALRAHEQQLETLLRLRDNDLKDANNRVNELTEKLKACNNNFSECKKSENENRSELVKCRSENVSLKDEIEKLKSSYHESIEFEGAEEMSQLKQEIILLQKELLLSSEREKRKDSLLELARSRQDRTELELGNLRLLYNTLQADAVLMKQQQWRHDDDDKLSVFSMSEFGEKMSEYTEKDVVSSAVVLNSTVLLDSPVPSLLASTECQEMNKFSPISNCQSSANLSMVTSVHNDDAGTMSTGELRHTDLSSSNDENQSDGINFDHDVTPASRLENLLVQSQQMVEDLEKSSTFVALNIMDATVPSAPPLSAPLCNGHNQQLSPTDNNFSFRPVQKLPSY